MIINFYDPMFKLQTLQDIFKTHILSDTVDIIYEQYQKLLYENYTIWMLIDLLDSHNIPINCPLNKKSIIQFIQDKRINILHSDDVKHKTQWNIYNIQYVNLNNILVNKYIISIDKLDTRMKIMVGDIYRINGSRYRIELITYASIIIWNMSKSGLDFEKLSVEKFMELLDDDGTTVEYNHWRDTHTIKSTKSI